MNVKSCNSLHNLTCVPAHARTFTLMQKRTHTHTHLCSVSVPAFNRWIEPLRLCSSFLPPAPSPCLRFIEVLSYFGLKPTSFSSPFLSLPCSFHFHFDIVWSERLFSLPFLSFYSPVSPLILLVGGCSVCVCVSGGGSDRKPHAPCSSTPPPPSHLASLSSSSSFSSFSSLHPPTHHAVWK